MSWHTGRLAGFDIESTSADPCTARIVTACVVQCGGSQPVHCATWLSDIDGEEIPAEATAIHGVTTQQARTEGAPAADVITSIVAALGQVVTAGVPVVAMNARYDFTLLDREARRHGIEPLADQLGAELRVIDPFVIDKQADRFRRGSRKLTALCAHYGVPIGDAHTADADAIAACRVVWRQGQTYPPLAAMSLDELHAAQIRWAAEQAASLQDYYRRTDPAAVVEGDWPLIPHQRGSQ